MILDWNHNNGRFGTYYIFATVVAKRLGFAHPFKEDKTLEKAISSVEFLDQRILAESEYVASNGHPTVADLQVFFDITMLVYF